MKKNPLLELESFGQSVWLDFLSRGILENGGLIDLDEITQKLEDEGVTKFIKAFGEFVAKSGSDPRPDSD